jgi:hypothetical protein
MTRATTGDVQIIKPTNNIYTALTGVALLAQLIGLIILFVRAKTLFGTGLF